MEVNELRTGNICIGMKKSELIAEKFCRENGIDEIHVEKLAKLLNGICMIVSAQCSEEYKPYPLNILTPPKVLDEIKQFRTEDGYSII